MTETINVTNFIGKWQLDPSGSTYQFGQPPIEGAYTIIYDGRRLHFLMEWKNQAGQAFQQVVEAVPDGVEHPYDGNPEFADTICYALVDEFTLDSTAKKEGEVTGYARRSLAPDGLTMKIIQSGKSPEGQPFNNTALYRRVL
jgi:hypothetical protein